MPNVITALKDLVWASIAAWLFTVLSLIEASSAEPNLGLVVAFGLGAVTNSILALRS